MHIWLRYAAISAAAVSMGFTAYFGWVTAGDDTFAKWFNAAGGALISFAVPAFFFLAAIAVQRQAYGIARAFFAFGCVFGWMDAASNTGALFSMREGSKINAHHATVTSKDVRMRLAKLQRTEADLIGKTSSVRVWQDSKSIKDAISDLEKKRARESKRGGCGKECEKIDDQVMKRRDDLAVSLAVEKANAELVSIRKKIADARAESKTTKAKVSPIDVITAKIGAIAAWDLNPGESVKEFVYLLITAVLGTGLTLLSGGLGYGSTWLRGAEEAAEPSGYVRTQYLEAPEGYMPQSLGETLRPAGNTNSSVTVDGARPSRERIAVITNLQRMLREEFPEITG